MYKISIVMPIYNVEEFIDESIQSVLNQTMSQKDIELIMVDDCSTDNSGKIAKSYADRYDNIKYYCLEQNSGMAGKPRNVGMEMATGKYLMFLDPDDYYNPDACELMYKTIEEKGVAFVTANFSKVDESKNVITQYYIDPEKYKESFFAYTIEDDFIKMLTMNCWTKIISRDFVMKNNISFLEGLPAEDAYFISKLFLASQRGFYMDRSITNYRIHNSSVSNSFSERFFTTMIEANRAIMNLCNDYNDKLYYPFYYIGNVFYLVRCLVLSERLNVDEKSEIAYSMRDILSYIRDNKIDISVDCDSIGFTNIFSQNSKDELRDYFVMMEKVISGQSKEYFLTIQRKIVAAVTEKLHQKLVIQVKDNDSSGEIVF